MTGAMFAGAGPEETERRIEQWAADFAAKADRYQEMQSRLTQLSATETSGDGAVEVTVDSAGVVTDLVLSDRAGQMRPQQLAAQILDTMRRAQRILTGRVQDVMVSTVGDDPATVDAVVANYEQRFPEPPEQESSRVVGARDIQIGQVEDDGAPPPPPPPVTGRPKPPPTRDDDDWDDGPLLR